MACSGGGFLAEQARVRCCALDSLCILGPHCYSQQAHMIDKLDIEFLQPGGSTSSRWQQLDRLYHGGLRTAVGQWTDGRGGTAQLGRQGETA